MARTPHDVDPTALNVVARRVLLDALTILGQHSDAVTIVGAQAVYLRTQEVALGVSAYTSDADLCLNLEHLGPAPLLEAAMQEAGFELRNPNNPGLWQRHEQIGDIHAPVEVDLLVPDQIAGKGRRGVTMPPHGRTAAGRVPGLEPALIDRDLLSVASLDPADARFIQAYVAGPAALFIAKAFKIHQRAGEPGANRLQDKDASDVVRLMTSEVGEPAAVAERFRMLQDAPDHVATVTDTGLTYLRELFGTSAAAGTRMAIQALAGSSAPAYIEALAPSYIDELLEQIG